MAAENTGYFDATVPGLDCVAGATSASVRIDQNKATVIQQVSDSATGTATIEVSCGGLIFTEFHPSTTEYDMTRPVVIQEGFMPWKWLRFVVQSGGTGTATFEIQQKL